MCLLALGWFREICTAKEGFSKSLGVNQVQCPKGSLVLVTGCTVFLCFRFSCVFVLSTTGDHERRLK